MQTEAVHFTEQDALAVGAVRAGDAERYRELVERHGRRVYAVAWARLGDATLAEEATQEAFIRAYQRLWLLGDGAKFAGWIASITRHVAINFGLRHRRELSKRERWALEQAPTQETLSQPNEADAPCTPEMLRQTLAELPDAHRECLVLFYLEGKSGAEAASALGISESALRVRLHRARTALRERLEDRLGDSLRKLGPAKTLVPAIMAGVLATSSTQAATAGGAGAAFLGTLAKLAPLKWLVPFGAAVLGALPSMAFSALAARAEQRNFRDPEDFRAQANRHAYRIIWVIPLIVLPICIGILALMHSVGQMRADWILAVFMVACLLWAWRMMGVRSRFQRGMVLWYGILAGGMVLKAVGLVSAQAYTWFFIAGCLWLMWVIRLQPTRMDNSLFFRAMMGMLETPPTATPSPPQTTLLEKAELKRFGKFLAEHNLINSVRWRPDGLLLRQTFVKLPWPADKAALFKAALPLSPRDSSNVLLHWNGKVTAQMSEADARTGRVVEPAVAKLRGTTEIQVAAAVTQAWQDFRQGDIAAADRALGEKPESEIFRVPPARAAAMRWRQASLGFVVLLFLGMMLMGKYPQILKPFGGNHAKSVPRSAATSNVTARLRNALPGGTNSASLGSWPPSNESEQVNQTSPTKLP